MERFQLTKLFSPIIAFFLINPVTASGLRWNIETVTSGADVYWATDITLDSSENPHVSYYVLDDPWNNLIGPGYTYWDGGTWQTDSSIDVGLGWEHGFYDPNTTIALDSNDYPVITYWWGEAHALYWAVKRARWNGSTWLTREIDKGGMYNSLALDSNDREHITYGTWFSSPLHYVHWDGSDWNYEVIDNGYYNAIALDTSDTPHVAYGNEEGLKYAYKDGPDWVIELVDTVGGTYASIALDSDGNPHIAHWYYNSYDLKYAFYDGASWHLETLDSHTGETVWPSIAIDSDGRPHIAYRDGEPDDVIKYIFWDGDNWVEEAVDAGGYPSLVLNSSDLPRIAYIGGGGVKFAEGFINTPPSSFNLAQPPDGAEVPEPVTLDWEDSTDDDGHDITYDVWYSADPSFDPHDEVNELTDSTYTFPEGVLSDGTTYYWKVRAWDGFDATWSGPDPYWSFTVDNELDVPVTKFSAESARNGIELSWDCAEPGVGFNLYRSEEATGVRTKLRETLNAELITGESPYSYLDAEVSDGVTYSYWLEAIDVGGSSETFGPASCTAGAFVPSSYALYQSRPNPARGTAVIAFDLPEGADVTLTIYDLSGRKVTTLVNEKLPAGAYERPVSGFAPGVYVYRLKAGKFSGVKKMVVVE